MPLPPAGAPRGRGTEGGDSRSVIMEKIEARLGRGEGDDNYRRGAATRNAVDALLRTCGHRVL